MAIRDSVPRYTGRIPSHSHGKACAEIPPIHGEQSSVPVYIPPVWLGNVTTGIHQLIKVAATNGLHGVKFHVYLDDWLIRASSSVQARAHVDLVLHVLRHLGWILSFSKSELVSSQQLDLIGMQFNTCAYTVYTSFAYWWCHTWFDPFGCSCGPPLPWFRI